MIRSFVTALAVLVLVGCVSQTRVESKASVHRCPVCAAYEDAARRLQIAPVSISAPPPRLRLHNHKAIQSLTLRLLRESSPEELKKLMCPDDCY